MNPIRLKIENFCGYENSEISFEDFSTALIVGKIRGNDKKSNGAGKSTIFNAIQYVLFNEITFSTLDKIVRHGTDGCRVSMDFVSSVDGQTYRIVRSKGLKSGSDLKLSRLNGSAWEPLTQTRNSETERELATVLNINYKTFCNSVLFSQLDPTGLASVSPGDRKKVLKEVLQLGVYSKYEAFVKKKSVDLEKLISEKRIILSTLGDPKKDIETISVECGEVKNALEEKAKALLDQKTIESSQREAYQFICNKITDKEKRVSEYYTKKNSLTDSIAKTTVLVAGYKSKLALIANEGKTLAANLENIKQKASEMTILSDEEVASLHSKDKELSNRLMDKKALLNSLNQRRKELSVPITTDDVCKCCRQRITEEFRASCEDEMRRERIGVEKEIEQAERERKETEKSMADVIAAIETNRNKVSHFNEIARNIEFKSKEIEVKRRLYAEYEETIVRNSSSLEALNKELEALKTSVNDGSKEQFLLDKQEKDAAAKKLAEISSKIESLRGHITMLTSKQAILNERLTQKSNDVARALELKDSISKLEIDYSLHQKVAHAFGPSGIPALITHSVLDDLQIESNILLGQFRPGLQIQFFIEKERNDGDLADTLGITFLLDGFTLEYNQLSGAQKLISSLALKLGLSAVLRKRLGADIKLLLIDEVDQSLDEESLDMFEKAIRLLQKEHKILIITHSSELKSRFQKAIVVEQDDRFISTAKVSNSW
jgi:DNA repair exonuclease SbcCD ATPase subunit